MIVFHEGLPRSGKSYETMVRRIIPALQSGREVVAYIEGLDVEKIAVAAELPVERVRELLFPLTRDQVVIDAVDPLGKVKPVRMPIWLSHVRKNALHVFDEAQNFWPVRARVTPDEVQAVAEHGHAGQDVVLMGQDYRDLHVLWRRRIEIKLAFLKLSAFGAGQRYSVTTWRHKGGDDYDKVGVVGGRYDPKYFGTYASHADADVQTGNYKESRATLWQSPAFKYGFPLAFVLGIWGAYTAWVFFHPKPLVSSVSVRPAGGAASGVSSPASSVSAAVAPDRRSPQERYLSDLSGRSRVRLGGTLQMGSRLQGVIEWVDGSTHVAERMTLDALRDLGVAVIAREGSITLVLGEWSTVATSWPMEAEGKVSDARLDRMKPALPLAIGDPPGLISIGPAAGPSRAVEPAGEVEHLGRVRNVAR